LAEEGNFSASRVQLDNYVALFERDNHLARTERSIQVISRNPTNRDITVLSPGYVEGREEVAGLLVDGRAQYMAGDYDGARRTFSKVRLLEPYNREASYYLVRMSGERVSPANRRQTREGMLDD